MKRQTIPCTGKDFKGLTDPHTGRPLEVVMLVGGPKGPLFAAPKAYAPAQRFATSKGAYDAWCRSEGIDGARAGEPIACAYTGERLVPASDVGGHYFKGGFDPRVFRPRAEFLYYAAMRAGKSTFPPPKPETPVETVKEPPKPTKTHGIELTDEAMDFAEDAMKKSGFAPQKKTRVSMSVSSKTKEPKKGARHG